MYAAHRARELGWHLGLEQRQLHDRLVPRVRLEGTSVRQVAWLAWQFEPHPLKATYAFVPHVRQAFIEGYEQGYHLAERPAPPAEEPQRQAPGP
jgi:hypothetical protein